jgi:hypothetical protein
MPKISKTFIILFIILIIALIARNIVVERKPIVTLGNAPALSGVIAQNIDTTGGNSILPIAGKDFGLKNIHYFDNNNWAVANITQTNNKVSPGLVVLQKKDQLYQVVIGPGTAFDNSILVTLPKDVGQYMSQHGVLYESQYE